MSLEPIAPPTSDDALPIALFERYCVGDAPPQELEQIEAWLQAHPTQRAWHEQVRAGLVAGRFGGVSSVDVEHHLVAILRRIHGAMPRPTMAFAREAPVGKPFVSKPSVAWPVWALLGMAAVVALGWFGAMYRPVSRSGLVSTYSTGQGERANITLPDGSRVMLNVASRLDVPADYLSGNHTVRLQEGAALFTIAHRAGRSFSVMTGSIEVRVLGTSFVVRHYATDTSTVIAVRDGKVGVRSVVLTAEQQVAVGATGTLGPVQPADPAPLSFASGVLMLTGKLLVDEIPELDRWYDADIRIRDPALAMRRLSGEYAAGSLADLASILEMTFGVRVVRQGRVLTLYPR